MKRLPPVEGMPKERPVCAWCDRPLKFWTHDERAQRSCDKGTFASGEVLRRAFSNWRGYPVHAPIFDTLRCALSFATLMHRAGYRRKEK